MIVVFASLFQHLNAQVKACKDSPLWTATYFLNWKAAIPAADTKLTTTLNALMANSGTQTKPALEFCASNFNSTCCTAAQFTDMKPFFSQKFKNFINQGPPSCQFLTKIESQIPAKCLNAEQLKKRPPPGKKESNSDAIAGDSGVQNTMKNISKGMVGVVNGVMRYMRTILCVICSGPTDWGTIFDTNKNIKFTDFAAFKKNITQSQVSVIEANKNCSTISETYVNNLTDQTKTGCTGMKNNVKNRRRTNDTAKVCSDAATCTSKFNSIGFGTPEAIIQSLALSNTTLSTNTGRVMQSAFYVESTTGGISTVVATSDDHTEYAGVTAWGFISLTIVASLLSFLI